MTIEHGSDGSARFRARIVDVPAAGRWAVAGSWLVVGIFVGIVIDTFVPSLAWRVGGLALGAAVAVAWLSPLGQGRRLMRVELDSTGISIVRRSGVREVLPWSDLSAARWQHHPVTDVSYLLVRMGDRSRAFTPELDDATKRAFGEALNEQLAARGIPPSSDELPPFERRLAQAGVGTFLLGLAAWALGHATSWPLLGTSSACALVVSAGVLGLMARRERLGRMLLGAVGGLATLAIGGLLIFDVDLRAALVSWEAAERRDRAAPAINSSP